MWSGYEDGLVEMAYATSYAYFVGKPFAMTPDGHVTEIRDMIGAGLHAEVFLARARGGRHRPRAARAHRGQPALAREGGPAALGPR